MAGRPRPQPKVQKDRGGGHPPPPISYVSTAPGSVCKLTYANAGCTKDPLKVLTSYTPPIPFLPPPLQLRNCPNLLHPYREREAAQQRVRLEGSGLAFPRSDLEKEGLWWGHKRPAHAPTGPLWSPPTPRPASGTWNVCWVPGVHLCMGEEHTCELAYTRHWEQRLV